jgi:transposase
VLGPPKERELDRSVLISLERLVPANRFYRHLDATLDPAFVREWVAALYATGGRYSIDPVVLFKFQLAVFFEGIRSERQLVEQASLYLAQRWYLGYHLDEPLPDRTSLIKIWQRLGLETFRRFFEHLVDLCEEDGLVWGRELVADTTKVEMNADLDSLRPRLKEVVDDLLVELFGGQQPSEGEDFAAKADPPLSVPVRVSSRVQSDAVHGAVVAVAEHRSRGPARAAYDESSTIIRRVWYVRRSCDRDQCNIDPEF